VKSESTKTQIGLGLRKPRDKRQDLNKVKELVKQETEMGGSVCYLR